MGLPNFRDDTTSVGRGPLDFDIEMARRQEWRESEIVWAWWFIETIIAVFQWWIAWRQGKRRRCDCCEQWTFKEKCHLCAKEMAENGPPDRN